MTCWARSYVRTSLWNGRRGRREMKRSYGTGSIDPRGKDSWRLRYRLNGRSFSKTVRGSKKEAQKELRRLLHTGDTGEHVAPDKMTVREWIEHWISIGCPGNKRRKQVGARAIERYAELLRCHVVPALGERSLQQLDSSEIDKLYVRLGEKFPLALRTMFMSCSAPALVRQREPAKWPETRC